MSDPDVSGLRPRPPWWVTIVLGTLLAGAISSAGWAGSGVLALRDEVTKGAVADAYREQRITEVERKIGAAPVQRDLDSLRSEMAGLRDDLRELRAELKDRRAR